MSGFRIIKRGVLFGVDGDLLTREDLVGTEEGSVQQSGNPVAVLFGTRAIDPVVVAWGSAGQRIVNYYDPTNFSLAPAAVADDDRTTRMVNLTLRMILCAGNIDEFIVWTAGGIQFRARQRPLPTGLPTSALWTSYSNRLSHGARLFEVAVGDSDLFGGNEAGGLGSTLGRQTFGVYSQYSQFFTTGFGRIKDERLDAHAEYRGLTSIYFKLFNFGGNLPPPSWQITATRIDTLTTRNDNTNVYKPQWQPSLATIQTLPKGDPGIYYLIALPRSFTRAQRQLILDYLLALPFDQDTHYQFITLSVRQTLGARLAGNVSTVMTTRNEAVNYLRAYQSTGTVYNFPTNFFSEDARRIVTTYGARAARNLNVFEQRQGVVIVFASNVFGAPSSARIQISNDLIGGAAYFGILNSPTVDTWGVFSNPLNDRQKAAVGKSPADLRLVLFNYQSASVNPFTFNNKYLNTSVLLNEFDGYHDPINVNSEFDASNRVTVTLATREFVKRFRTILPVGRTMNPIHALRETLTNKSWGKGIDESYIDDGSFLIAAQTCFNEKLDFCYLHKSTDSNPIVKQINDYVDGITYYNPATDKVTIKLIRNDYSIGDLQSFDESTIGMVTNFKRQQANRLVNGVTVKYHDVSLGTDETVSIHDLESTSEQRAAKTANLSLPGCATREAAARVAARELSALSKSIVSCTVNINPTQPLGLGDVVVISYRDLGLARIVMRVAKIDYGTGLTGGINVDLIQDVFSDPYYADLVGDVTIPTTPEMLADLPDVIKFLELSANDLSGVTDPFADTSNRYFKLGRVDDPLTDSSTVVNYNGRSLPVSIGVLQTAILPLTRTPVGDSLSVLVTYPHDETAGSQISYGSTPDISIRVEDEVMTVRSIVAVADDLVMVNVTNRAVDDTVAVGHPVGATVYFLADMAVNTTPWGGGTVTVTQTQGGLVDSAQITPNITFIGRGRLPLPPAWVSVDGKFIPQLIIDGDITIRWQGRSTADSTNSTVISLTNNGTELYRNTLPLPTAQSGVYGIQTQTITAVSLSSISTGVHDLDLTVSAVDGSLSSWQSWTYKINWSSSTREREGWTYNFGNNWGDGRTAAIIDGQPIFTGDGWDYQWDQHYDD